MNCRDRRTPLGLPDAALSNPDIASPGRNRSEAPAFAPNRHVDRPGASATLLASTAHPQFIEKPQVATAGTCPAPQNPWRRDTPHGIESQWVRNHEEVYCTDLSCGNRADPRSNIVRSRGT